MRCGATDYNLQFGFKVHGNLIEAHVQEKLELKSFNNSGNPSDFILDFLLIIFSLS